MSFQQNSFQQNAFQNGVGGGSAPAAPFTPSPLLSAPSAPYRQGGYSTVPNLLVTTLALFAAASQDVKRDADLHSYKPAPVVQAFQPPNLLTSTLGVQVQAPVGDQSLHSAPSINGLNEWQQYHNPLLFKLPLPTGEQRTDSAPPPINIGAAQQNQSRLVLEQVVQPIPIGRQQTDSAPSSKQVLYWDKGTNTLLFVLPMPVGQGEIASAPIRAADVAAQQVQSRAILDQAQQPLPIGAQRTENEVQTPSVQVFTPEQIIPPTVVQAELPPGHQSTDSSPPTPRIGEMIYARGVDPGPPAPESGPLPIGRQETESAPYTIFRPLIDEPQNLLAGPLGLQPVASSQSEWMLPIQVKPVYVWLPPNVTINLPITTVTGSSSTTNTDDTSSANGTTTIVGTSSYTNINDTSSAVGSPIVNGTSSTTNADDTSSASGSVGSAVSGDSATTNNDDTSSANGTTTIVGTSSTTNENDTNSATGTPIVTGSAADTNNNDISTASGISGTPAEVTHTLPMTGAGPS